ncbi:MAG: hypothetical protein KAQ92_05610, partial [Candidatus Aenigmarchaeota archaeon]|nr:hypothetical protein [Candidatus Aenigmarchaeota archaeon]
MTKRKATIINITVIKIVGIILSILFIAILSIVLSGSLSEDHDKQAEAKATEIRNALLYLNTVEEGIRIISVNKNYKVILETEQITVEYPTKNIKHTFPIAPINKNIVIPATVESVYTCISKRIHNCVNEITICKEDEACCKFEPLDDTLCTSSNP